MTTTAIAGQSAAVRHRLQIASVERLTAQSVAVTFDVPANLADDFRFRSGQHVTLVTTIDGQEVRRTYSLCSPPAAGVLRVAIKALDGGLFSAFANAELRAGDELDVMRPAGSFGIRTDPNTSKSYAAFVAGSGITPLMAIIADVLAAEALSTFTLIYGNRSSASVMFLEELSDLKDRYPDRFQLMHVLSAEANESELLHGRIDQGRIGRLLDQVIGVDTVDEWLLCGPFGMVDNARAELERRGVDRHQVHLELFHVEGEQVPLQRKSSHTEANRETVTIRLGGRTSTFDMPDEGSILDAVLAVRPDAPFACKGGVCGTCRASLVEGSVDMARSYALEQSEIEAGYVLTCQSVPTSPTVTVDYDV